MKKLCRSTKKKMLSLSAYKKCSKKTYVCHIKVFHGNQTEFISFPLVEHAMNLNSIKCAFTI